jgi:hypothetical protein
MTLNIPCHLANDLYRKKKIAKDGFVLTFTLLNHIKYRAIAYNSKVYSALFAL